MSQYYRIFASFALSLAIVIQFSVPAYAIDRSDREITIMAYNMENLFDAQHDEGKEDYNYLPQSHPLKGECANSSPSYREICFATDWTDERVRWKLDQIKSVFMAMDSLPDIVGVEEVENIGILTRLANHIGYERAILEEGPDARGIDVGLMYRSEKIEYIGHHSYRLEGPEFDSKPTRDVLAVYFSIKDLGRNGPILAVYVNHWPSQAAPATKRFITAEKTKEFIQRDQNRFGRDRLHAVILGDFNTVPDDYPHPFKGALLTGTRTGEILDAREVRDSSKKAGDLNDLTGVPQPIGSYFYPREMAWQYLDRIFVSGNLQDAQGLELVPSSFTIFNEPSLTQTFRYSYEDRPLFGSIVTGVPKRFNSTANSREEMGFSDHFPVLAKFRY